MKGGGHGGSGGPPPLRLPLPSGSFLDHLPPAQKRARFNLLLLEHGEVYLGDYAVVRYRGKGRTKVRVPGRLKVSSRSLVFDPVGDASQPLLRFPYKHVARLSKYTPSAAEAGEYGGETATEEGLFIFACSCLLEMKADDVAGPYVARRCGVDDYEGPDFVFRLQHTPLPGFLGTVDHLLKISAELARTGATAHAEETLLRPLLEERERASASFDLTHLVDFGEKLLLPRALPVDRISPLIRNPGVVMLTDRRLYFQPAADLNNVGSAHPVSVALRSIVQVFKRRYMLRQTGLEVFFPFTDPTPTTTDGPSPPPPSSPAPCPPPFAASSSHRRLLSPTNGDGDGGVGKLRSILLAFRSSQDRDRVHDLMMAQPELQGLQQPRVAEVTRAWQARRISNLEYLSYLNTLADRSYNDLTQYPVFPWVIADYSSRKLDLDDPRTFRDLSKPIGALNEERLAYLRERMQSMPEPNSALGVPPKFLYGTHYSTPGYVLFYLVRAAPEHMLCLQDGKFDAADRMFVSVADTWRSCLSNPADLKELIPDFYCSQGKFLLNADGLPLGTTQAGVKVDDVGLPPWAKSERDFCRKLRKALNDSAYVSAHLHEWVDLVFGAKQRGPAAEGADNLFYYLTYEGAVDLETVADPVERAAFEAQIREFGQTPKQVFIGPHPPRDAPPGEGSPILLAPAFHDPHAPPHEGGPPSAHPIPPSSSSAPVPIPPAPPAIATSPPGGGGSGSGGGSGGGMAMMTGPPSCSSSSLLSAASSTDSGGHHGGCSAGGMAMGMSMMRPRGGSGTEAEWELVRGESLLGQSFSQSLSTSLSQSTAGGGWEIILSRRASEQAQAQQQQQQPQPPAPQLLSSGGGHGSAGDGGGEEGEGEGAAVAMVPGSLSPASRITVGLLASPSAGAATAGAAARPPRPTTATAAPAAAPEEEEEPSSTTAGQQQQQQSQPAAAALHTPRPLVGQGRSVRMDPQAQARLDAMILRAQEGGGDVGLLAADDSLLQLAASAGVGGGGEGEGEAFPLLSPLVVAAGTEEGEEEGFPAVVRLEDLVSASELARGSSSASFGGGGDNMGTATGGGAPDDSETTTTATSSNNTPPPPSSPTLTPLRLEAASAPLSLHRDKVSALAWLPPPPAPAGEEEGGGEAAEAEASSLSLGSTSDDGSFRLSGLVWEAGEGAETALVLRSKRHFAPSDVALSCCGLVDGGGRDGGAGNPLAVLSSWDNRVYVYSIRSARRLLELDAHDDGVAALALAPTPTIPATAHGHNPNNSNGSSPCPSPCPSSYLLATGAWDATVKVWSLQAPSGEIDPSPLAEFFDLAAQVQTVAIHVTAAGAGSTLVAAGAEDGRVAVWDVKARGLVASFQATAGGAPVAAVRWGKGAAEAPCLYVAGGDGALACYALDGRRRGAGARLGCELRCLEVVEGGGGGDVLVVGGGDGSVSLWAGASLCVEMAATPLVVVPEAHGGGGGAVTAVAVDWRRRLLATGGQDGGVRVWRVVVG